MAKPEPAAAAALRDWHTPVLLVGCGNMAGAMLARWLDCGLPPERVRVVDPARASVAPGIAVGPGLPDAIAPGTIVLLGVKPQHLGGVAPALNARLHDGATILSILAGIPLDGIRAALPGAARHVRLMPNLPVRDGRGVVLNFGAPDALAAVAGLLAPLGLVETLPDERDFDLATAISGCGPAFVYRFVDALATAGVTLGLAPDMAARLSAQTIAGAAMAALGSAQSPAAMAEAVASPGGMTREGLDVLDADGRLVALLVDTLTAARDRGVALAKLSA